MNALQISALLSLDPYTSRCFKGFGWVDTKQLPYAGDDPALYVLNTDMEMGRGEHWCVVYYDRDIMEFFDPFGSPPVLYDFDEVLNSRESRKYLYNSTCVQNPEAIVCGHHCVHFAFHRCRDISFQEILDMYDGRDLNRNDRMVRDFVMKFGYSYKPSFA